MDYLNFHRKDKKVLSVWIDVFEDDVKQTVYHDCFVDFVGNIKPPKEEKDA